MSNSRSHHGRARLIRTCALALLRLWTWILLFGAVALLLSACGGGGGDGSSPPSPMPPAANSPPVSNAGADQLVLTGAAVTISGAGTDSDGSIASYAWTQTAGAAVTLSGASGAVASFTAPMTASTLEFRLTVTDNHGATHFDTIAVTIRVMAAPVIAHHPTNVRAHEHASALFFVHASGEDLSYEWTTAGGTVVVKSASTEPFLMRGTSAGLAASSDGDCYRVVVSNSAGSVTSEPGCLEVMPMEGDYDPTDEDNGDDYSLAEAYGNSVLHIVQESASQITGGFAITNRSAVPHLVGPRQNCFGGGEFAGSALDGQIITQATMLPLGRHTVSMIWRDCGNGDPDEPSEEVGGVMIDYDFPSVFGVGSYTMYFSGFGEDWQVLNGRLVVNIARDVSASGWPLDQVGITLQNDFSAGALRCECPYEPEIELTRRLNMAETLITDATLEIDGIGFSIYDEDNFHGYMSQRASESSRNIDMHFDPDVGDTGVPAHTSDGQIGVALGTSYGSGNYLLGVIVAARGNGGGSGWVFNILPPEDPDED